MKNLKLFLFCIFCSLLLAGCTQTDNTNLDQNPMENEDDVFQEETELVEQPEEISESDQEEYIEEIDLALIQPNEAGEIMVLMYHHIQTPEAEWARTPDNFRKDLEVLYENGFRPISLTDYVTGNITTEAGMSPMVMTFDDGNQNQFNLIENSQGEWVIDPDSAVGILVDFHEEHPDFPLEATFFINGGVPFGQKDWVAYKLNFLIEKGMDIGNHTSTHVNFSTADKQRIEQEVGQLVQLVKEILPAYQVNTLALPFGSKPKDGELFQWIVQGEWETVAYENIAVLEVGWDPYYSPYHQKFSPQQIRRVRASETKVDGVGMYDWLKAFDQGTRLRYVSDGDPHTVTVPEKYADRLKADLGKKAIKTYSLE